MPRIKKSPEPEPTPQAPPSDKCVMCGRKIIKWRSSQNKTYDWDKRQYHRTCYYRKINTAAWI